VANRAHNFTATLNAAIDEICRRGFDPSLAAYFAAQIERAARARVKPLVDIKAKMKRSLMAVYRRAVPDNRVPKHHEGLSLITMKRIEPQLRTIMHNRIFEIDRLVKKNQDQSIEKIENSFLGWANSVPPQGAEPATARDMKAAVAKQFQSLRFAENRVFIDQSHKLRSNIDDALAIEGGAIAQQFHSNWRQAGYNYRPDHKERDGKVYLIRDSWALKAGLIKPDPRLPGGQQYGDQITRPGEEIFCRCWVTSLYSLRDLEPFDMLTKKGVDALKSTTAGR
jgi:hypothetical protein